VEDESTTSIVELAARTAHEVNRAYCEGLGDWTQKTWEESPAWQRESAIAGAKHILADPETSASESHEGWCAKKRAECWIYGPVKDASKKEHPCMVPFDELPVRQKVKDILFGAVVRGVLGLT